jgi:P-type Ca2+ transporter type 2C
MHKEHYKKSIKELYKEFKTSPNGISDEKAKIRLKKEGKNIIKKTDKIKVFEILLEQFKSFLIYILIISSVIMFLINKKIDSLLIFAVVIINIGIGFFQQYKSEKAIIELRKIIVSKTKIIRNGIMKKINSSEIVPGDIIFLEQGDKVTADCRIIEEENLQTNESVLTGESNPIDKSSKIIQNNIEIIRSKNMIFTGTSIVRGRCKALVIGTGKNTFFGKIAETLQTIKTQKTPMQKRIDLFSKQLSIIILIFSLFIFLFGLIQNFDFFDIFLTTVTLAISAIPEGLPTILSISFAISSVLLSKKNVIVKKFSSIETLGSVTVICSDKTGTITEGNMAVQKIFTNNKTYLKEEKKIMLNQKNISILKDKNLKELIKTSILCNNSQFEKVGEEYNFFGEPTEVALIKNSLDLNFNKKILDKNEPLLKKFEFDSNRKMMSILRNYENKKRLYSKGAIEKIIDKSEYEIINNNILKLNEKRKKEIIKKSREMEKEALRIIAFAYKDFNENEIVKENSLIFLGFIGLLDPPRKEVNKAIKDCEKAGIKIKIITGDSAITASAIAKKVGIKGKIITENELRKMSDKDLKKNIDKISIFARMTPQQKYRITKILQEKKEIVAITGDGVNDILALKSADVGIAMGIGGTDIARNVSDIILMDNNFASVVKGVEQGRITYNNIKKFTKYLLSVNFSEILLITFSIIMAFFFGGERWFLPLLPLQILWINLITDSFPAITLALEKDENALKSKPLNEKSIFANTWKFIIFAGLFTLGIKMIVYLLGVLTNIEPTHTRTIILTTAVFFEIFFVYTCRSNEFILGKKLFSNRLLNIAILLSISLHLILLYTPISKFFDVIPLTLKDWIIIIPLSLSGLFIFEIVKLIKKNYIKKS